MTVPKRLAIYRHVENPVGIGKVPLMTPMTVMTMICRGSLKGVRQLICVTTTVYKPNWLVLAVVTLVAYGCPVQAIVAAFGIDERTVARWQWSQALSAGGYTSTE